VEKSLNFQLDSFGWSHSSHKMHKMGTRGGGMEGVGE